MTLVLTAIGLVFVIEGLALALAPSRVEQVLAFLTTLSPEQRRMLGLAGVAAGVAVAWGARLLGG